MRITSWFIVGFYTFLLLSFCPFLSFCHLRNVHFLHILAERTHLGGQGPGLSTNSAAGGIPVPDSETGEC